MVFAAVISEWVIQYDTAFGIMQFFSIRFLLCIDIDLYFTDYKIECQ